MTARVDESEDPLESKMIDNFMFLVDGIILTAVSAFGIVGTLMSIFVLVRPRLHPTKKEFFSKFLVGLGISDTVFLFSAVLLIGLPNMSVWFGLTVATHYIPAVHGILHVARMASVYITISVTVERYCAVVHPLKNFTAVKKFLLPVTVIFSVLYNVPKFFEMETYTWPYNNSTDVKQTALRLHPLYEKYYVFWSKVVVMEAVPYLVILLLNVFIVREVCKSKRFRRSFETSTNARPAAVTLGRADQGPEAVVELWPIQKPFTAGSIQRTYNGPPSFPTVAPKAAAEDDPEGAPEEAPEEQPPTGAAPPRRPTIEQTADSLQVSPQNHRVPWSALKEQEVSMAVTLVGISMLFICCQSIKLIPDIYEVVYCSGDENGSDPSLIQVGLRCQTTPLIEKIISFSNLLAVFNSAANFLVYMLRGKKFRDYFIQTYCSHLCSSSGDGQPPLAAEVAIGNTRIMRRRLTMASGASCFIQERSMDGIPPPPPACYVH